jgi:hypothetical protein
MLLVALFACSSYALPKSAAEGASLDTGAAFDAGGESAADAPAETPTASHWTVSGTVRVVEGRPTVEGTSLTLLVVDGGLGEIFCAAEINVGAALAEPAPDPSLSTWWSGFAPDRSACPLAPARIGWGTGPLEPDLLARLGPAGLEGSEGLLGSYVALEDAAPLALGVALPSPLAEAPPESGEPPTDWLITPLYLVPLDAQAR